MIIIRANQPNTMVVTVTQNSELSNPEYLFSFTHIFSKQNVTFIPTDISTHKNRYDEFYFVEGNGAGEIKFPYEGLYLYAIWEQPNGSGNLNPALATNVVENGEAQVLFQSGITMESNYDIWMSPNEENSNIIFAPDELSPGQTPSLTPTTTPTPGVTQTVTPTNTPSVTPSVTQTNTPSYTPSETPTLTPSETPTNTPSVTPSITPSVTQTNTPSITPSVTQTNTPSVTPSITPSETPTNTPSVTPSITPSVTQTSTPTVTPTITQTNTPSVTPTLTQTPTSTLCVSGCCFQSDANSLTNIPLGMEFFNDGSIWVGAQNISGTFIGTPTTYDNRLNQCGGSITAYTITCVVSTSNAPFTALMDYKLNNRYVATSNRGRIIYGISSGLTLDSSFNQSRWAFQAGESTVRRGVYGLYVNSSDQTYAMGLFSGWTMCSGGTDFTGSTNIVRLGANGDIDRTYSGISIGYNATAAVQDNSCTSNNDPNGRCLVLRATSFTGNTAWKNVFRFNEDGTPDATFNNSIWSGYTDTDFNTSYALSNGKYLIGGSFLNVSGISSQDYLCRINSDGTLDTTFVYSGNAATVLDIDVDKDSNIYVCQSDRILKLDSNGTLLATRVLASVLYGVICDDCNVYAFGGFNTTIDGVVYRNIIKLNNQLGINMCPYPTPTMTPSPTNTPTLTRTPTMTPTKS